MSLTLDARPATPGLPGFAATLVHTLRSRVNSLPESVVTKLRLHVADALGIGVAAATSPIARQVHEATRLGCAHTGQALLLSGGTTSPLGAAFINASLVHLLDFDDIHDQGRLHPGAVIVPAVMAAAALCPASDIRLEEALAMGSELVCRLAVVCSPEGSGPGAAWFLTQLFGYMGAALAASHVLDLSVDQTVSALGLAYMQAAGGKQAGFGTGATARAIYPAFAAQGGVQAALLARAGIQGPEGALEGDADLFRIYLGVALSDADKHRVLHDPHWHLTDVNIKPWPCCRLSHPYVAVGLLARSTLAQYPQARVRLAVNGSAARLCRPLEQRRIPCTLQDAKYSVPFMTAYALVRGEPSLLTLGEQVLTDTQVLAMAQRIEIDECLPDNPGHPRAVLDVEDNGKVVATFTFSEGLLEADRDVLKGKFDDCFAFAGKENRAQAVWDALAHGALRNALQRACA